MATSGTQTKAEYEAALVTCSRVAAEEYRACCDAMFEIERLIATLSATVGRLAKRQPQAGSAVQLARQRLQDLQSKLTQTMRASLETARGSLKEKHARLDRFTVTLFGRTMAGKSTIREALTGGDGSTIGKGAQRTTRDIREYDWRSLRVIDTPGIGAYEGDADRKIAESVINQSDLLLFLVSSDGVQEESFRGMQTLRDHNKPIIFLLNIKLDLIRPVNMRRFLRDPSSVIPDQDIQSHNQRIRLLAGEHLGMRDVRILPIHAQAAFLATRPEFAHDREALFELSRLPRLFNELRDEVLHRGAVRRLQTILDSSNSTLMDFHEEVREQAKTVRQSATYLREKFSELDAWIRDFAPASGRRIRSEASEKFKDIRMSISSFIDENIERSDVGERWNNKIKSLRLNDWIAHQQKIILDEVHARLTEFSRQVSVEIGIGVGAETHGPTVYDPWDVKRTLKWISSGSMALAGVAGIASLIGGANFWNPVGWLAGIVGLGSWVLSWFFNDREAELQRGKAKAARELREQIDQLESRAIASTLDWLKTKLVDQIISRIQSDTRFLIDGMFDVALELDKGARQIGRMSEAMSKRLVIRAGTLLGQEVGEGEVVRVARDPGLRAKILWAGTRAASTLCKMVGEALGEWLDWIPQGPPEALVAAALTPARVSPSMVSVVRDMAVARLPNEEIGRAMGRGGANVALACRLVQMRIKILSKGGR